jgi:DNA-binding beta-propeller fold protein YncE
MLEASLLLMGLVLVLALAATALVWTSLRVARLGSGRAAALASPPVAMGGLCALLLTLTGCGDPNEPEAIWLRTGAGPGQVVYPRCIDYNAKDDTFFVVDRLARVQHIDDDGHYLSGWTMPDAQNGKPTGVTVGPDGNVYLADTHYQRVMVYDPKSGKEVRRWGSQGTGPGQFIYPTDVAFDEKGHVFVSEYGDNDRIQVFDPEGKYLYAFGKPGRGPGELARPQSMVIDGGLVYVTDASNHRISVFKTDGTFVRTMGSVGAGLGQFRWPYGLAQDRRGNLVVCEFGNNRVQLIDRSTGRGLKVWGGPGRAPGELAYPWAVAVDKRGRIVTVDAGNNRLQVFEF